MHRITLDRMPYPVIPPGIYGKRHLVGNAFLKLKHWRMATRYAKVFPEELVFLVIGSHREVLGGAQGASPALVLLKAF
jgi:hypothetical protein